MRIQELNLLAYGKFTNHKLIFPAAKHDFHVVVGPNEAGKSTVRRAITELLFGIARNSTLGFKHPLSDLRIAGALETAAGRLEFMRTKQLKSLRSVSGDQLPDSFLDAAISSLNEDAFGQLHCLDHTSLLKGGQGIVERRNSVGQILFEASSGLESFAAIREVLGERAGQLFAIRGKSNEFAKAADRMSSAQKTLKEQQVRTRDWVEARDNWQKAESELETERRNRAELEQQRATWERVRRLTPLIDKLTQANEEIEEIEELGETIAFPASAKATLDAGIREMNSASGIVETRKNDVKVRRQQLDDIEVDEKVAERTADIEQLAKLCALYANHPRDLPRRRAEVDSWVADALERSKEFNWGSTEDEVRALVPAEKLLRVLSALLKDHGALSEAERAAIEAEEQRQSELNDLQQRLDTTSEVSVDGQLSTALAQAMPHKNSESKLTTLSGEVKLAATRLENALAALGQTGMTPERLRLMKLPSSERVASFRSNRQEIVNQAALDGTRREEAKEAAEILELQVKQFEASHKVVTAGQVNESRRGRDTIWGAIKAGAVGLPEGGPQLDTAIRLADELVDARTISEADSASFQGLRDQLELSRDAERRHANAVLEKERELQAFDGRWSQTAASLGLDGMELDDFPDWLLRRESALAAADLLATRTHEFEQERESVARAHDGLAAAIAATGLSVSEKASLAVLCDSADAHVKNADAARAARESLQQQVRDAQTALQFAQKSKVAKSAAVENWSARWNAALREANLTPVGLDLNEAEAGLEAAKYIHQRMEKIDTHRSERIAAMEADLELVRESAHPLAQALTPELADMNPDELSRKLTERAEQTKLQAHRRMQTQQFMEEAERQLAEAQSSLEQTRHQLEPLMKLAGVDDPLLAVPFVEKADRKRDLEASIKSTTGQLQDGSDGLTLEQIRVEVGAHPVAEATGRLHAIKDGLEDSERKLTGLVEARTAAKQQFDTIDGGDSAALAEAQRQEAIADMSDAGEEYLQVATANSLLKWAVDKYRDRKQGPLLQRASAVFKTLTLGSFEKLRIDYDEDPPVLLAYRANGQPVMIAGLSDGTRDQLYLALRIAALELQSEQAAPVPFIADDLFINFDDKRSQAGLQALYELSTKTQVLFLTHQEHLLPVIYNVFPDVNVITLDVEELHA